MSVKALAGLLLVGRCHQHSLAVSAAPLSEMFGYTLQGVASPSLPSSTPCRESSGRELGLWSAIGGKKAGFSYLAAGLDWWFPLCTSQDTSTVA